MGLRLRALVPCLEAREDTLGDLLGLSRVRTRPAIGASGNGPGRSDVTIRLGTAKRGVSTEAARAGTSALLMGLRAEISPELIGLAEPAALNQGCWFRQ
jgi:hypothetical protein